MSSSEKGSVLVDPKGTITFASSFFCALVRVQAGRAAGKSFFDFVFPEDLECAKKGFEASQRPLALPYPLRLRRSDGTEVWVAIQGQPLQATAREVYGIATTITLAPALPEGRLLEERISFDSHCSCLALKKE